VSGFCGEYKLGTTPEAAGSNFRELGLGEESALGVATGFAVVGIPAGDIGAIEAIEPRSILGAGAASAP
jgi:hypothetical protein